MAEKSEAAKSLERQKCECGSEEFLELPTVMVDGNGWRWETQKVPPALRCAVCLRPVTVEDGRLVVWHHFEGPGGHPRRESRTLEDHLPERPL